MTGAGFQQDRINSLFLDREAGLLLALYSGIAKAEFQTGLSIFDYLRGLPHDAVLDVIRYKGQLFAATGAGLYRLKPPDHDQAERSRFERVADLKDVFSSLAIGPDGLLAAGSSGVLRYVPEDLASNGPRLEQIVKGNVSRILVSSPDSNLLYVGEGRTIRFFYRGAGRNTWEELSSAPVLAGEVTSLAEVPQFHELWAGTPIGGVIRLTLASISDLISGVQPRQQWLSESAALPKEKSSTQVVYLQAGDVLLITQQGLYEPAEERTNFRAASRYGSDKDPDDLAYLERSNGVEVLTDRLLAIGGSSGFSVESHRSDSMIRSLCRY